MTDTTSQPPSNAPSQPDGQRSELFSWYSLRNSEVHLFGFALCVVATVLLTKLSSLLSPFNLYFTFSELITGGEGGYSPLPLLIKAAIPFLVGAGYFSAFKRHDGLLAGLSEEPSKKFNLELTAQAGAGFGALLLSWPAVVLWEFVVSDTVLGYRLQFILVYALYVISFAYLASAGVVLARLAWTKGIAVPELQEKFKVEYQLVLASRSLIIAIATGGFADWASKHLVSS